MHDEARAAVKRLAETHGLLTHATLAVCDLGGRNVNGSLRGMFATHGWTAVDSTPGNGVDVVADARTWVPDRSYDLVLCTEVFEHVKGWPAIIATAERALAPGGLLIATCASDRRPPHGMSGGPWPEPGEHYCNVQPAELAAALADAFPRSFGIEYAYPPGDLYAWAEKTP
ncbi:class I SAM-dependent methyltransferase [Actinomadura viridis]|uniref:class I SAM-dependent methyltransferase n=1 Tax=Actinomadura viridis TaxID=58110 RepID=UPI00367F64F7